jgi:SAM-dependent methyltransferase
MPKGTDDLYPGFFAHFYDVIYDSIRSDVDSAFFLDRITSSKGPVLEVGVGTGRFFLRALNAGIDIRGIDISPSMVDILRKKLGDKDQSRVSVKDIRDFDTDRKFSLIIAPFRVFMHLDEPADQLKALNNVYDNLEPGGEFIFDLFIPDPKLMAGGIDEKTDFEGEYEPGETVQRITSAKYDLVNQVVNIRFRLVWTEKGKRHEGTWNTHLRFFFRYELEALLQRSKFTSFAIYGDYQGSPLSGDSKEFVVVCRRE